MGRTWNVHVSGRDLHPNVHEIVPDNSPGLDPQQKSCVPYPTIL